MLHFLLASLAWATPDAQPVAAPPAPQPATGELTIDARVPAEVQVDGRVVGQLFTPSRLELSLPAGERQLAVVREGRPESLVVDVPAGGVALVVVGKTGTSVGDVADLPAPPEANGPARLEVRVAGDAPMQLRLGAQRFDLAPEQVLVLELARGTHPFSVRNGRGTVVWSQGTLELPTSELAVLQISEGRMPEISGDARLVASRR